MRWMKRRLARRSENGAVAVIFALLAVLMLSMAAIGVDLGNAMNRKKQTQTSADFAALAGAVGLPAANLNAADASNASTVQAVADYINENQPRSDGTDECGVDPGSTTVATLTDTKPENGEVTFLSSDKIKVLSPPARVQFGLATAMGFENTCVQSVAVAAIKSGSLGMAPYYVTTTCASGLQTMKSNAGGLSIPVSVPVLNADGESNTSTLTAISPNLVNPMPAAGAADGPMITLTGTNLGSAKVDKVGFFNSDRSTPFAVAPAATPAQSATSVSALIPNEVATYQDVWYVRVHEPASATYPDGRWSSRAQAQPLQIGDAVLSCDPDSASGNFGAIDFPRGGNGNDNIEESIKNGLPAPMTLKAWPGSVALPPSMPPNDCQGMGSPSVWSSKPGTSPGLQPNTNCVQSTTGLSSGPASDGYLGETGSDPTAKLRADTSDLCKAVGQPTRDHGLNYPAKDLNVNADLLSCFLADDSLKLSDTLSVPSGADPKFVPEIYESPRFVLVPVTASDPSGTKWMPIVRFVPGFITNQPTGASRVNNLQNPDSNGKYDNGLIVTWSGNKPNLGAITVFFFDMDALPTPPEGTPLQDYMGSGPKVITLID